MSCVRQIAAVLLSAALLAAGSPLLAQQTQDSATPQIVIRATTELVLVNVIARDKKGNLIRDLKKEDFTVTEDGKKQDISTFDFENVDELAAGKAEPTIAGAAGDAPLLHSNTDTSKI